MVSIAHATGQTLGRVLYDNKLRRSDSVITFSGTVTPGQLPRNAYDWRDFSIFQVTGSEIVALDAKWDEEVTFNTWGFYAEKYSPLGATVKLQVETAAGSGLYTDVDEVTVNHETFLFMRAVDTQTVAPGVQTRVEIDNGADIMHVRQIVYGTRLDFPIGQHQGIKPPTLVYGIAIDNNIAVNGSILGRGFRRMERKTDIVLEYLEPSWVRTYWEPFSKHMVRFGCFYSWDPSGYPTEVVFAVAPNINPPENAHNNGRMSVSMPLHCISDDLEVTDDSVCHTISGGALPASGTCQPLSGGTF
jgi:hypothetical protein